MAPTNYQDLMKRVTEEKLGDSAPAYLNVWIYFNLIGNTILLPIVVLTFLFSKNAKRHPTLVNLCITWIFSGIFSLLLFYSKEHVGPDPDLSLCIAQASLLYGITPMWSVAVFAMFYYMVHTLRGEPGQAKLEGLAMAAMLSAPYIVQCSFTIAALSLALQRPEKVTREGRFFFCSLSHGPLFLAMTVFTLIMCVGIVILEVVLACIIYRSWRSMRNIGVPSRLDFPLVLRVLLFGVYVALGMVVNILSMFSPSVLVDLYGATAGTVVFLIFGTQSDVIRTWCFWRKDTDPPDPRPPSLLSRLASRQSPDVFKSARSDKRFPFSEASPRPPSDLLSRGSSKSFRRLPDEEDDPQHMGAKRLSKLDKGKRKEHERVRMSVERRPEMAETQKSPVAAKSREERRKSQGGHSRTTNHSTSEVGKPESARKVRREVTTRPKGPRKASISSLAPTLPSSSSTTGTSIMKSTSSSQTAAATAAGIVSISADSTTQLLGEGATSGY